MGQRLKFAIVNEGWDPAPAGKTIYGFNLPASKHLPIELGPGETHQFTHDTIVVDEEEPLVLEVDPFDGEERFVARESAEVVIGSPSISTSVLWELRGATPYNNNFTDVSGNLAFPAQNKHSDPDLAGSITSGGLYTAPPTIIDKPTAYSLGRTPGGAGLVLVYAITTLHAQRSSLHKNGRPWSNVMIKFKP